jgi:predicted  nucleic acid-binding Zn-ribbon protein
MVGNKGVDMAEGTKKCLSCGAVVAQDLDVCPICGGRIFETGEVKAEKTREYHAEKEADPSQADTDQLSWSPDEDEDTLEMPSFTNEVKQVGVSQKKPEKPEKKKRTLRIVRWYRRKKKAYQKQKAVQARAEHDETQQKTVSNGLKKKFDEQPPLTRKLIVAAVCACAVVIVVLIAALAKRSSSGSTNTAASTAVTSATAEPSGVTATARSDGQAIGTLTVNDDIVINIRVSPSTDASPVGVTQADTAYEVYAIQQDADYTWYQIGAEEWIADGGGWVAYTEGEAE